MEENVLKDFETFNEFPDKYLKLVKNSNYYLINRQSESFIVRKNLDSILITEILEEQKLLIEKSYYDIVTGELVLNIKSIKDVDGNNEMVLEEEEKVEITPIATILNLKENGVYYLSKDDIGVLVGLKEENSKTYRMKPRKYY